MAHRTCIIAMLVLLATGAPGRAEGPPPEFFAGTYDLLGQVMPASGQTFADVMRITPFAGGLSVETCRLGSGELSLIAPDSHGPDLTGHLKTSTLRCNYHVDQGNYPLLVCGMSTGVNDDPSHPSRFVLFFQQNNGEADGLTCPD